ncbi:MAG: ribosomal protein methylthiotransferase [Thermotogota bacterium]|nr:ribosomal protein methylthiotransferase [Thermotogota bacterium]MDK2865356.1 ribosomal protein methylthiotransferase [Thermotogota bacterium]
MKIYVHTLGCPKNEADMHVFKALALKKGHTLINVERDIDPDTLVVVDTCGFIEEAKIESIETLLEFSQTNRVVAVGCLVQRYYKELKDELPELEGLIGVVSPETLLNLLEKEHYFYHPETPETVYDTCERTFTGNPFAYLKISDGCDRSCSFCAIPTFKGRHRSRSLEVIRREAEKLVSQGIKEIILVAQDTTAYGVDLYGRQALPELLSELENIPGDFWIRVMYLHPDHINEAIVRSIAEGRKTLPYFDIPVQHGSDHVLKLMGRSKSRSELIDLFRHIREMNRDAVLRTTVMVGHPGETEEDFEELKSFLATVRFDRLGAFIYSDEEGTLSYSMNDKVDRETAQRRLNEIMELQSQIAFEKNEGLIGKRLRVLVEDKRNGELIARSFMDAPEIDTEILVISNGNGIKIEIGDFCEVEIVESLGYDLEATLL